MFPNGPHVGIHRHLFMSTTNIVDFIETKGKSLRKMLIMRDNLFFPDYPPVSLSCTPTQMSSRIAEVVSLLISGLWRMQGNGISLFAHFFLAASYHVGDLGNAGF